MSDQVVILGGSGFIGSAIARGCLRDGVSCVPLSSQDCDLTDSASARSLLPRLFDGSAVVYAAGISRARADTPDALQANRAMIRNTVAALREARPTQVVFMSTVEVYGMPDRLPIDEQTAIHPGTDYATGKHEAEQALRGWQHDTGVPLAILRLPGVYGPEDGGRSIVGKLVACARSGESFSLFGDGTARRDYVWVDDVARVVINLVRNGFTELTLNVATGNSLSIRGIIDRVSVLYGPVPLTRKDKARPDGHLEFDVSRLRDALPGIQLARLEEGLESYRG